MKRRSIGLVVLIAVFALIAAACSSDDGGGGGDFKIAIIAPSASNDLAFTQSIVDAANVLLESGEIGEVAITDNTFVVDDAAVAIRDYASQGYDLVIAHGSQYGGSLQEIAPD
ncbi:MAG: BMP family ABC transporter substrate-binding protein, partial [Acidimicrobiia bacterium]|nr:BMP family ABC transporter substrate-binding protein [Acidimicrobiia bacterium]